MADPEISRFPRKERPYVGTRDHNDFAARWLAYMLLCRRFAYVLADACARLEADVDRYSFIEVDLHHKLLAGPWESSPVCDFAPTWAISNARPNCLTEKIILA